MRDLKKLRLYEAESITHPNIYGGIGNQGGAFRFVSRGSGSLLFVIASDGEGWDHVSVSRGHSCPTWDDMCEVKDLFFDPEEVVIQFHPRESEYVNFHPHCLHLWKPQGVDIPTPPPIMIGPVGGKV